MRAGHFLAVTKKQRGVPIKYELSPSHRGKRAISYREIQECLMDGKVEDHRDFADANIWIHNGLVLSARIDKYDKEKLFIITAFWNNSVPGRARQRASIESPTA